MLMLNESPILVAEPIAAHTTHLLGLLGRIGYPVRLASGAREVLEAIRREVFPRAIVAVELVMDSQLLLRRLSRLPAMELLMATGPPGAADLETRARVAGAQVYLPRPVAFSPLMMAIHRPLGNQVMARPP